MADGYVFDTEPLIAFLYGEPGHEGVARRLADVESQTRAGSIAEVTATELYYLIGRIEGVDGEPTAASLRIADRDVRSLERRGLSLRRADWRLAGEIKAHGGLSFADAYAVALAAERRDTLVVGGDDDFDALPLELRIERVTEGRQ